jgi:hypothetical protein
MTMGCTVAMLDAICILLYLLSSQNPCLHLCVTSIGVLCMLVLLFYFMNNVLVVSTSSPSV